MAQRQLRVQVTSQVDKSLTDLLSKLDKYSKGTTINVKAVTNTKDVTALFNTVDKLKNKRVRVDVDSNGSKVLKVQKDLLALKNKTVSVKVDADTRSITKVNSDLNSLKGKTFKVNADLSQVNKAKNDLNDIDNNVNKNRTVKIKGDTSGLTAISNALDSISSKVLSLSTRGALNIGKSFAKDAGELYDAQNEFVNNMRSLDNPLSDKEINSTLKNLSKYGAQTKYNVAELTNLAGALKGAGFDKDFGGFDNLTKNLANISALSSRPSNALKRVSTQIKQMSLDGKVLARDWNPIRDAIGGTATQKVVQKFKDEYGFDNLADAMKEGKVLGKDFIKVLNEVGQDPALLKAATNTKTLKSAWDNMRESLTVGLVGTPFEPGALTPAIDGLVKLMNTVSQNGDVIQKFIGKGVSKATSLFKEMFGEFDFKQSLKDFVKYISPVGKGIELLAKGFAKINANGKNTGKILGGIITASAGWLVISKMSRSIKALSSSLGLLKNFKNPFSKGGSKASGGSTDLLGGLTKSLGDSAKILAFAGSIKLIASAFKDIGNTDMDFTEAITKVGSMAIMVSTMAGLAVIIGKVVQRKEITKDLLIGATTIAGVVTGMLLMAKAMEKLNDIKFDSSKISNMLGDMLLTITAFGSIATAIGTLMVLTEGIGALALGAGLISIIATAGTMVIVAKAMESVSKTVDRINKIKLPKAGTFSKKMLNLTALVTEMSLASTFSGITSTLAILPSIFGAIGNKVQAIQVKSIVDLANKFKELQESMGKVPDKSKFIGTLKKLKSLLGVIAEFNELSSEGTKNSSNSPKSNSNTYGNLYNGLDVNSIIDNISRVSKLIDTLSNLKMPEDLSTIKNKLKNIANIQKTLNSAFADISSKEDKGGVSNPFIHYINSISSYLEGFEVGNNIKIFNKLSEFVEEIKGLELPDDISPLSDKIKKISLIHQQLNQSFSSFSLGALSGTNPLLGIIDTLKNFEVMGTFFDKINTSNTISTANKLIKFIQDITNVEIPSDTSAIDEKISSLSKVMNSLRKLGNDSWLNSIDIFTKALVSIGSAFDSNTLDSKIDSFTKLINFIKKISNFKLDSDGIKSIETKLDNLKKALDKISDFKINKVPDINEDDVKSFENVKKLVDNVKEITDSLNNIPDGLDISAKIESVKSALAKISELVTLDIFGKNTPFTKDVTSNIKIVTEFTSKLSSIATSLNEINSIEDLSGIPAKIEQIKQAVQAITESGDGGKSLMSLFDVFNGKSDYGKLAEEASNMISSIKSIADSLINIPELNVDGSSIEDRIDKIKRIITSLTQSDKNGKGFLSDISKVAGDSESVAKVLKVINDLKSIAEALVALPVLPDDLADRFSKMNSAITLVGVDSASVIGNLQKVVVDTEKIGTIKTAITSLVDIANTISQFPEVNSENFITSVNNIKTALSSLSDISVDDSIIGNITNVLNTINQIQTALAQFASTAPSLGQQAGEGFANSFVSGMGSIIVDKMNEQKDQIDNIDWKALGSSISKKIADGFDVSAVTDKIDKIQTAIDSLKGKTVDITINETTVKSTKKRQHGGIIPEYHSTGGVVGRRSFASLGTDTIPAMLTAGEYVLKRSVSSMLGKQFLDNLNQMNLTQALKALAGHTGHSVVNNTTNNITQNVDNKASFINGLSEIKGVVRP